MRALRILFMLFVISVLVSQSAMDFFSILLCGQWAYEVWRSKDAERPLQLIRPMGLELLWILWFMVVVIGFLLNWNDTRYAMERIIEFKWILIFYVLIEVINYLKPSREILKFLIPLSLVVSICNLILYFSEIPFLQIWRYRDDEMVRAGGFFANPMTFAHSFVLFVCFLMGIIATDFKNWKFGWKFGMGISFFLSLLGLYLTYTRGVWIGFAVGVGVGIFLWKPKYIIALCLMGGVVFWGLYKNSVNFRARIDRTVSEFNGASERKVLWGAHFYIFQKNPFFGAGYGQNTKQLPKVYEELGAPKGTLVGHAHNEYLHLAAGTGILGLLCYLVIWAIFLKKTKDLWLKIKTDSWDRGAALGLMIGQIAFVVGSFTEANFEHSKVRFMVMLVWAYVIYLAKKYKETMSLKV